MASKRALRRKSCAAKVRHPTKELADEALTLLKQKGRRAQIVRAYNCDFCGGWHLGHPRRRKRTRRKEFAA